MSKVKFAIGHFVWLERTLEMAALDDLMKLNFL